MFNILVLHAFKSGPASGMQVVQMQHDAQLLCALVVL